MINVDTTILITLKGLKTLKTLNDLILNLNLILVLNLKSLKIGEIIEVIAIAVMKRIYIVKLYRLSENVIELFDDIKANGGIKTTI